MSEHLYPTLTADGWLSTPASDDCSTLHKQITSELDKYLQEAAERHEVEDNYFDRCHKSTNTSPSQQEDYYLDEDDVNIDNASKPTIPESHEQDTNSIKPTYDNDSDTNTGSTKHDQNIKGAPKETDIQDNVQNARHDNKVTHYKWSTETNEIDNQYLRDYDNIHTQIEDKQNEEYYKAQRQIHNVIMGDTPVKTAHNRQYIDNISTYHSELQRISKSVRHKLDLGQNSLPGAQWYITVKAAADIKVQHKAIKVQDKAIKVQDTEDIPKVHVRR